jgi:hypothetical protein
VIRPDDQTSWRTKTKSEARSGGKLQNGRFMSRGMHVTGHELVIGWLTTGCREGDVRGLGIPGDWRVVQSDCHMSSSQDRVVVVPLKSVKVDGGKGDRELDSEVEIW